MSLINQMLNELERRGAGELPVEQAVRAVPVLPHKRRGQAFFALALLGVAGLAWQQFKAASLKVETPASPVAVLQPASASPAQAVASAPRANPPVPVKVVAPERTVVPAASAPTPQKPTVSLPTVQKPVIAKPVESAGSQDKLPVLPEPPVKQVTPQQQADHEYRQAMSAMRQGRVAEAVAGYESALRLEAGHDSARWALAGWLVENTRHDAAEQLLRDGLRLHPQHTGFAMLLARLQVERGDLALALETMNTTLPHAGQQADYRAFMAALLQRMNRHAEAIPHYQVALQQAPGSAVWLMGMAISLHAEQRNADALEIFRRAAALHTLSAELQTFVERRIAELSR
jgi:MSHA biogenesis protein MshN